MARNKLQGHLTHSFESHANVWLWAYSAYIAYIPYIPYITIHHTAAIHPIHHTSAFTPRPTSSRELRVALTPEALLRPGRQCWSLQSQRQARIRGRPAGPAWLVTKNDSSPARDILHSHAFDGARATTHGRRPHHALRLARCSAMSFCAAWVCIHTEINGRSGVRGAGCGTRRPSDRHRTSCCRRPPATGGAGSPRPAAIA